MSMNCETVQWTWALILILAYGAYFLFCALSLRAVRTADPDFWHALGEPSFTNRSFRSDYLSTKFLLSGGPKDTRAWREVRHLVVCTRGIFFFALVGVGSAVVQSDLRSKISPTQVAIARNSTRSSGRMSGCPVMVTA